MGDLAERKNAARAAAFSRRKAVHDAARSAMACSHLQAYLRDYRDHPISGYMPIRTEIDPRPAMAEHSAHVPVGVPIVLGAGLPLEFHRWTPETEMQPGSFGARVPVNGVPMIPRILILPLAAFDSKGHRLGYGGGFYDRTLEKLRRNGPVTAVGFAYAGQAVDALPIEATDQPLDAVITENGILRFAE